MIIKIQKPIIDDEGVPMSLMHNRDRTFNYMIPFAEVARLFDIVPQPKIYAKVQIQENQLLIENMVSDQDF